MVVIIAATKAHDRQINPAIALTGNEILKAFIAGNADIKVAISQHHDAVDGVFIEVLLGKRVGEAQAFTARSRATSAETIKRCHDCRFVITGGRL